MEVAAGAVPGRLAADAKLIVDDDAAFRQTIFQSRSEEPGLTALEREGRAKKLSYVDLDGDVALMGNGAGLVLSLLDLVRHFGATPANFLDTGGGASRAKAKDALTLVLKKAEMDPKVKSISWPSAFLYLYLKTRRAGCSMPLLNSSLGCRSSPWCTGLVPELGEEMLQSAGVHVFPSIRGYPTAATA